MIMYDLFLLQITRGLASIHIEFGFAFEFFSSFRILITIFPECFSAAACLQRYEKSINVEELQRYISSKLCTQCIVQLT